MLLRSVPNPAITGAAACKVCTGIQSGEFAGHVWVLRLNRAYKPRETSLVERTAALFLRLFWKSRPHFVFRAWPTFLHRLFNLRHRSGHRPCRLRSRLLSWGCPDNQVRGPTCNAWSRKPFTCLVTPPHRVVVMPAYRIIICHMDELLEHPTDTYTYTSTRANALISSQKSTPVYHETLQYPAVSYT